MSQISGYVEQVTRQYVRGWAYDSADPSRPLLIEVLIDGKPVAIGTTDQPRPDLTRTDTARNTFGFLVSLPEGTRIEFQRMTVRIAGSSELLPMAEKAAGYEGFVEAFGGGLLNGWAWHSGHPDERVRIVVRHNGEIVGSGIANQLRPDLIGAGVGDGRHAFLIALPMIEKRLDPALLFAEFEATGAALTDLRYPDRPPPPRPAAPARAEPVAAPAPASGVAPAARPAPRPPVPVKKPIIARPPMARPPAASTPGTSAPAPRAEMQRPIAPRPVTPSLNVAPPPAPPVIAPRPAPAPAVAARAPAAAPAPQKAAPAPAPVPAPPAAPTPTISKELYEALRGSLYLGDEGGLF